jgi:hypothetical protein
MTRKGPTIKIYHWFSKKRYLKGKYVYKSKRIYVPIPSKLHHKMEPCLNQRFTIDITKQNSNVIITLAPVKSFLHAESPPDKTTPKQGKKPDF